MSVSLTGAGGLGTPLARWVFVLVWVCSVWADCVTENSPPLTPLLALAYALGLVGGLLLTTPGAAPLSRSHATCLPLISLTMVAVVLAHADRVSGFETVYFATYLVAFAIPRGNPVAGVVGSVLVIGYASLWAMINGAAAPEIAELLGVPIGCLIAGIVWALTLRWIVGQERHHRSEEGRAAQRTAASMVAVATAQQESATIRAEIAALMEGIIDGTEIDNPLRVQLIRTEAAIRDRITVPHLQDSELVRVVADLREKEVTVVVLGEPSMDRSEVDDALITRLIEVLSEVDSGRITVRSLPPGEACRAQRGDPATG
ncbi:hypothetical protein [Corynebacterium pacaense]|uniref:hypothetical protein n=1 Tax=Corynebacterium pacaense TaxID=1816684 RepID=UPI0009BAE696|nr:hypothetical protein [Corynebacterium pacaense]